MVAQHICPCLGQEGQGEEHVTRTLVADVFQGRGDSEGRPQETESALLISALDLCLLVLKGRSQGRQVLACQAGFRTWRSLPVPR